MLEKYVRQNATYRLESWLFVSRMHTFGIFVFLMSAYFSNSSIALGLFIYSVLVTVWAVNRYVAEWSRIAKQHPDWD